MTARHRDVLRELAACPDGRASSEAVRLVIRASRTEWIGELLDLSAMGLVVEDRRAPGVLVLTATGARALEAAP